MAGVQKVRRQIAPALDQLPPADALAVVGELLVLRLLDGQTTVQEF